MPPNFAATTPQLLKTVGDKRVVHFLDSDKFGGCEQVVLLLLEELRKTNWEPVLFHHDEPNLERLVMRANQLGVACRAVPRMSAGNLMTTLPRFVRTLHEFSPAVFHAHLNWPLGCRHALMAAKLGRVPGITATLHLYSGISEVPRRWFKQRVQAAMIKLYIAVSNGVKERLSCDLAVPETKLRVVHNGVPISQVDQGRCSALREAFLHGSNRPIILTPARLHDQKGHQYLLEAAVQVPEAIFLLAGDGPERSRLEEQTRILGIESRVRFLGQRDDVQQLLAICDLFVLPSLYEGFPLSVLEAMAAGKPVIATRIIGTEEAVDHGKTGLLVPAQSAAELAVAIRTLLSDRALACEMGVAAKKRVKESFSSEVMARGVARVYDELVDGKN